LLYVFSLLIYVAHASLACSVFTGSPWPGDIIIVIINIIIIIIVWLVCVSSVTRGHKYKLYKQSCNKSVRSKFFFVNRVINVWNNLPQDTDFSSFNLFKCAIENMDLSQYLKYEIISNS